jgi:gamma-butyrobetaine dioxygenase
MSTISDYRTYTLVSTVERVRKLADSIEVTWADNRVSRFHNLWLRDNCPCSECNYSVTREQVFQIADVPRNLQAETARPNPAGGLKLVWDDAHVSDFSPEWLRAHAYDDESLQERQARKAKTRPWLANLTLPVFQYDEIMSDDKALLAWLTNLRDIGLTQVQGVPQQPGSIKPLANRISFIRESNFGVLFDVRSKADADSNAYTSFNLPLHTDLPTRELQPGVQFLHCLLNDAKGGNSSFVDGFSIAHALREEDAEAFELLTNVPVEFRNKSRTSDYRCVAPVIALNAMGEIAEVRMANFLRAPFEMPEAVMKPFYFAYRRFIELTRESYFQFSKRLEAGQMWAFDNRRVMHARDAFDPATGDRHFQGCYLDRDELLSRIYVLERSV